MIQELHENWKDIIGCEGLYAISDMGNTKSFVSDKGHRERILVPYVGRYCEVRLYKNGKGTKYLVHRLVAIHFIPNPENKPQVNHKKGNKLDNRATELEWSTAKENSHHAQYVLGKDLFFEKGNPYARKVGNILGFQKENTLGRGEKNVTAKLTENKVHQIRRWYATTNITKTELGKIYNISGAQVCNIINRKQWAHI